MTRAICLRTKFKNPLRINRGGWSVSSNSRKKFKLIDNLSYPNENTYTLTSFDKSSYLVQNTKFKKILFSLEALNRAKRPSNRDLQMILKSIDF